MKTHKNFTLKRGEEDGQGWFLIDNDLGQREKKATENRQFLFRFGRKIVKLIEFQTWKWTSARWRVCC